MKRPQGFDRPTPRASRTESEAPRAGVRAPRPAKTPSPASKPSPSSSVATTADHVATEPIPVVAASVEPERVDRPHDAPSDARSAKRALAAAARERRRYERQEVRRFTKRSRRRRITWTVAVGSVLALVAVVAAAAYSPLMALREVRIEGAQRIPAAEVQAAFDGVLGTPLPLIESGKVHAALSGFPLIETYATEMIPPGTLVVRIVERTPVGVIDTDSGLELVDAAGVVIERPEEHPEGQPLIEVEGGVADEGFRAVAGVVRSLPPDVRAQLTRASADTADDVRLELTGGANVVWGSAEESAFKATVLAALMRGAPPDTVAVYDVSAPSSPVTR